MDEIWKYQKKTKTNRVETRELSILDRSERNYKTSLHSEFCSYVRNMRSCQKIDTILESGALWSILECSKAIRSHFYTPGTSWSILDYSGVPSSNLKPSELWSNLELFEAPWIISEHHKAPWSSVSIMAGQMGTCNMMCWCGDAYCSISKKLYNVTRMVVLAHKF